jgi:hypothetical protein
MKLIHSLIGLCAFAAILLSWQSGVADDIDDKVKSDPAVPARIHTIGIISTAGRTIIFQNVGLMVFGNKNTELNLTWNVDDYLIQKATEVLGATYEVIPVTYKPEDFFEADPPEFKLFGHKPPRWLDKVPTGGADAYLIFNRDFDEDFVGRTNQTIAGFGIYKGLQAEAAYGNYRMFLVDGNTHEILEKWVGLGLTREHGGGKYFRPMVRREKGDKGFDGFKYPKKPELMTDDDYKRLETELKTIVDEGLPLSLALLGLADNVDLTVLRRNK